MDYCLNIASLLLLNYLMMWQAQTISSSGSDEKVFSGQGSDPFKQAREADLVVNLPGQPKVEFAHYSGYVTVNESHGRALFYWFFEATSKPSSKPLVLWLNGGPGCSSVGYGATEEIGPFRVKTNGTGLYLNKYSWNQDSNLLFVESPAGVGFSYSNSSSDYANFGDRITAEDTYSFLQGWFDRFPHFKLQEFYITGESYAGHYIPELAEIIYDRNKETSKYPFLNLKGFMVGNPATDDYHDTQGFVDYAWSHAVISDQIYNTVKNVCDFRSDNWTTLCNNVMDSVFDQYKVIDIYNLYTPICEQNGGTHFKSRPAGRYLQSAPWWKRRITYTAGYDPCVQLYSEIYLNRPDVQKSLHANITGLPFNWSICSNVLEDWKDTPFSMLPVYKKLIDAGLRIWVYSGDTDGRVPVTATRYSLNALQLSIKAAWRPWFHHHQVGGWTQEFEGLVFLTVRGAGHMVPLFQPSRAQAVFRSFLCGTPLPTQR
eukprot:c17541_g2_i1 orf=316-1773(-)